MEKEIKLTESEICTLQFYMRQALINAEGMYVIGVADKETVSNIKSILNKVR